MKVLVTGAAGFIGFHLAKKLLEQGHEVIGFDAVNQYYDPSLKKSRLLVLSEYDGFVFYQNELEDFGSLKKIVESHRPELVYHLAAQAGVRYSLENPQAYINSNLTGTFNLLEALKQHPPIHLMFASTSSVYGGNERLPFGETDRSDFPVSLYAATKRSGEALTHSYSHLYSIPTTCFRFFTVYGPWGRPDMALFKFVRNLLDGAPIEVYGDGKSYRDFTYVEDLIESIVRLSSVLPVLGQPVSNYDSLSTVAPWRVVNVAGGNPVILDNIIEIIEASLDLKAERISLPDQAGDVTGTSADSQLLFDLIAYNPSTPIEIGVESFINWYRAYYQK